jgi:signal transduction histidine kinase
MKEAAMAQPAEPNIAAATSTLERNFPENQRAFLPISVELQHTLQHIVDDVVIRLGCVGAMVATLEGGVALPVQAYSLAANNGLLAQLEERAGLRLIGPEAVVYLDDKKYRQNLSFRAVKGDRGRPEKYVVSDQLYDLLRPFVDEGLAAMAQQALGVKQVVAVPFFLEEQVVGNLFAANSQPFSARDIEFLTAFGYQAATAIQSQRHLAQAEALERVILVLQANITDETQVLQTVVDAVVQTLGYAGAMVATLEPDNALPVRAYAVDFAGSMLRQLEERAGVSLVGPRAVTYLDENKYKDNLSVRAVRGAEGRPENYLVSDELYDLFRPVVNRPISRLIQRLTAIQQVIAVPFYLEDEVVGNLFAATRKEQFSEREIKILTAFGQQAAVGIRNARLYRKAEERRQIAQMFGKMAFSATASVHTLRNHLGAFRTFLKLVELMPTMTAERQQRVLASAADIGERINDATKTLDNLHEPWRDKPDVPTSVNNSLTWALRELFPRVRINEDSGELDTAAGIILHRSLAADLPNIHTSPDMLIEAFRVLIKNGVEAIQEHKKEGALWLTTSLAGDSTVVVTIRDSGIGIKPENLRRIFDMGWSTKQGQGMGFGLFWAKDYIEGLGGVIQVTSVWKQGTTFRLSLPAVTQEADNL